MRWLILAPLALLSACTGGGVQQEIELATMTGTSKSEDGMRTTVFEGPGYACSIGFAIDLGAEEKLTTSDRGMDFLTHSLASEQGGALLYEGNFPQAADGVIETGQSFPALVAIHLRDTQPGYTLEDIEPRIAVGKQFERICPRDQ